MRRRWSFMNPAEFKAVERCLVALDEAWQEACENPNTRHSATQMVEAVDRLTAILSTTTTTACDHNVSPPRACTLCGGPDLEAAREAGL